MAAMALVLTGLFMGLRAQAQETPTPAPVTPATPDAPSAADPFADPMIRDIQQRHQRGLDGDKKAVTDLIADLERLTKEQPANQLLRAYLGSAYTLLSRDLFPGPGKLKYLKLGLQTMDEAVAAAPDAVAVRFLRAVNNFSMPAFVGRKDSARNDFQILVKQIRDPAIAASLNVETRQAIFYYAGTAYKQLNSPDEATAAWKEGLALDRQSELGKKMSKALGRIP